MWQGDIVLRKEEAEQIIRNLVDQIERFAEEQGEADFYTGEAHKFLIGLNAARKP